MTPLIDFDILQHEIGFSAEYKNEEGDTIVREWDFVEELLDQKIAIICEQVEATGDPILYLTADKHSLGVINRWRKTEGKKPLILKDNFRNKIATVKGYKKTRKSEKPAHYNNITAHALNNYYCVVANGVEADDLMAIAQTEDSKNTIICSRDKDLRQVAGWHYSWECGKQPEIGPIKFSKKGYVKKLKSGKVFGGGETFFLYQLLAGDAVDNIPGLPKCGPVKAMKILEEVTTRKGAYDAVRAAYREFYEKDELDYLTEQARLLWLLREPEDIWEWPYE